MILRNRFFVGRHSVITGLRAGQDDHIRACARLYGRTPRLPRVTKSENEMSR
ncbi:MAG: hypothetical protein ACLT2T_15385 [Bilophila wadsworthia]